MDNHTATIANPEAPPGSVERLITDEHVGIRGHLAHMRQVAADLPKLDEAAVRERASAVLGFLTGTLLPHAASEEASFYPAIDRLLGAGATRTMTLDHEAIVSLVRQLASAVGGDTFGVDRAEAQRLLFVLEGLITTHLWKEDAAYVPLLARLAPAPYTELHARVATHAAHHEHGH